MRALITQLESMNEQLENVSVVRDSTPQAAGASTNVLTSAHIELVKRTATSNGWQIVEVNDVFCEAKFERDGNEIEWSWTDAEGQKKPMNKFAINLWTSVDGVASVLNARVEHAESIFAEPDRWHDEYDCRKELSSKEL